MSPRVPTAFRPLETTASFESPRRATTTVPSFYGDYSCDFSVLSRLEERWCPSRPATCRPRSDCVAPVPRRGFAPCRPSSSSSSSLVDDDAACMELRSIFGHADIEPSSSRSSSLYAPSVEGQSDPGFFPLEEIVVRSCSPISRSSNPMPMNEGFGASF
ncbi:hypothetical protein FBU59_000144 [Linderina macrospora]|uniref:Uncharacterized protein n=1 Tax=Linderina macrospora TaxID=4868 RepID=A0ACC1JHP6_9FUNG|nr:hypothetical protein FBU59_000144 [Linderina macrospora]